MSSFISAWLLCWERSRHTLRMLWELAQQAAKNATPRPSRIEWKRSPRVYLNTIALGSPPIWYLGWEHQIGAAVCVGWDSRVLIRYVLYLVCYSFFAVVRAKGIWISHVIWIRVGMTSESLPTADCGSHKSGPLPIKISPEAWVLSYFFPHWLQL